MNVKIIVDRFCMRKDVKEFASFNHEPTAQEIYEFLGGRGKFKDIDKIMRE